MTPAGASVLVTGGSRGIGKAIALRFAALGAARVAIGYLRSDAAAEQTAEELRALGAEPVLVRGNVTSTRVLDEVAALGPLDVLVGTSKAALESVVRYLAVELAPRGIRANAVSAGVVETGALDHFPNRDEMLGTVERTPAGRLVEPEDVAAAVTFLCSPEAEMVRGQTLVVDGGYSLLAR